MPPSLPDFAAILAELHRTGVRYVLIGGLAMVAQGSDHQTMDIDICYARDRANLSALVTVFAQTRPRLRGVPDDVPFVFDTQTFRNTLNFTLETSWGAVDLLGEVAGIESFDDLLGRAVTLELFGIPVPVASLDDLIAMKRAANRLKDQTHLLELLALKKLTESADEQV